MAVSIVSDLLDMMPDTIVGKPAVLDEYGDWVLSGSTQSVRCRISGRRRLIRDSDGNEVVTSVQAICGGTPSFTVEGFVYDLQPVNPSQFPGPKTNLSAIAVKNVRDENGPHHVVVMFE